MNAIVVSGDAETLKIVGELIEKLDVAPPEPAAAAKPSERGEGAPTQTFQRASIGELEQAIAKLQRDLTLAEDKTREAAAALRQAEQAEKAASGEAKTAALFRKLKAEVAAQRERNASARIKSEFQAACNAYREAIASSGTVAEERGDAPPSASSADERLPVLEVYHLKHAKAEATVKELSSLFVGQENFRFVADPRTNALIVFGTREQQEKIQQAIRSLDVPAPGER
jgi:type II secretory pathway component GspD/PulD (secretin)